MTTPITAKTVADKLRELATLARMEYPALAAQSDAEADRLDPPTPTGKTVTWNSGSYRMTQRGIEYQLDGCWIPNTTRGFIDAVVLPLLADAPDGPIPDETVERACRVKVVTLGSRWEDEPPWAREASLRGMRAALEAVRGLPGMAVVRAGKPPEVLTWGLYSPEWQLTGPFDSREVAHAVRRDGERVVAIIADPGEGTV